MQDGQGSPDGLTSQPAVPETSTSGSDASWDGTDELRPFDDLLRQAARYRQAEPPKDLCQRTLQRCLMHAARPPAMPGRPGQRPL